MVSWLRELVTLPEGQGSGPVPPCLLTTISRISGIRCPLLAMHTVNTHIHAHIHSQNDHIHEIKAMF